jgi:hypothetical protein
MKKILAALVTVAFVSSPGFAVEDTAHPAMPNRPSPDAVAGTKTEKGLEEDHAHSAKKKTAKKKATKADAGKEKPASTK